MGQGSFEVNTIYYLCHFMVLNVSKICMSVHSPAAIGFQLGLKDTLKCIIFSFTKKMNQSS